MHSGSEKTTGPATGQSIPRIHTLSSVLIDKIAAGEVIEGPFSVVKELLENSLDAGADRLLVESRAGGMERIYIEDNGCGIMADDLPLCLERHATSKIRELADLDQLLSFGFRGEAISAIASVSHMTIRSRSADVRVGSMIECRGGQIKSQKEMACQPGTSIEVTDLFYATPARRKFIKSERSENMRIAGELRKLALARADVSIRYVRDGKERFNWPACRNLQDRIIQLYHKKLGEHLLPVDHEYQGISLSGFCSDENYFRANREGQYLFVNGRAVDVQNFSWLVKKAYGELLASKAYPWYFLFLELDPARLDVNVHPRKQEVRLLDQSHLYTLVQGALSEILRPRQPLAFQWQSNRETAKPASILKHFHTTSAPELDLAVQPPPQSQSFEISSGPAGDAHFISGSDQARHAQIGCEKSQTTFAPKSVNSDDEPNNLAAPNTSQGLQPLSSDPFESQVPTTLTESGANHAAIQNEHFLPRRHFGTIFGTYILAEGDSEFYLIDQHTAHERVNYERKKKELARRKAQRQALLTPIVIACNTDEKEQYLACRDQLAESGFVIEDYGPQNIAIRELPDYIESGGAEEILIQLMQRIIAGESQIALYDDYAAMKACKASIKKNDQLAGGVLSAILQELSECENPSRCPHGRPTMMRISRKELDQLFHRI